MHQMASRVILSNTPRRVLLSTQWFYSSWNLSNTYMSSSEDDADDIVFSGPVPRDKLEVRYSRSSGPGGQNVNKLNTKAEVRFNVDSADWLSDRLKERTKLMFKTRLNKDGQLIVVSQKHRSQHMNLEDAIARLAHMLREASEVPKGPSQLTVAKVKALKRSAERRRLTDKKYHSSKKRDRTTD